MRLQRAEIFPKGRATAIITINRRSVYGLSGIWKKTSNSRFEGRESGISGYGQQAWSTAFRRKVSPHKEIPPKGGVSCPVLTWLHDLDYAARLTANWLNRELLEKTDANADCPAWADNSTCHPGLFTG
jgi:hypothetical protein